MQNKLSLASFKNIHRNKKIVVCGCGASLLEFEKRDQFITIGISDIGRLFTPTYLLVANHEYQYPSDRFKYIYNSRSEYCFTHLPYVEVATSKVVRFKIGTFGGIDFSSSDILHYTNTSAYMALCLAIHMGANPIGLIGIDFTDHHFFAKTGPHPLARQIAALNRQFRALNTVLVKKRIRAINLSSLSLLDVFERRSFDDFALI